MQKASTKITLTSIATIALIMTIAIPTFFVPTTDAHSPPWKIKTWTYAIASPNLVGLGQDVTLVFWSNEMPPQQAAHMETDGPSWWK